MKAKTKFKKRDLRIYYHQAGALHKVPASMHKCINIQECHRVIEYRRKRAERQYLIIEYTDKYESEIIYIDPIDISTVL